MSASGPKLRGFWENGSRRENAEYTGVALRLVLRRRAADCNCGRRANRAPDLLVDATAPDRGSADNAQLDPPRFFAGSRLRHRGATPVFTAHRGRAGRWHAQDRRCGRAAWGATDACLPKRVDAAR